jgi:hypothetical protein
MLPMENNQGPTKKEARHQIAAKIEAALTDLKTVLGKKEFDERLKKTSKIFSKGFKGEAAAPAPKKEAAPKKETVVTPKGVVKKVVKKAAVKKAAKKK